MVTRGAEFFSLTHLLFDPKTIALPTGPVYRFFLLSPSLHADVG